MRTYSWNMASMETQNNGLDLLPNTVLLNRNYVLLSVVTDGDMEMVETLKKISQCFQVLKCLEKSQ